MSLSIETRGRHVAYAEAALNTYRAATNSSEEDALGDLLTDLLHLAHHRGFNVLDILQRATLVFCDEASEEEKTQ